MKYRKLDLAQGSAQWLEARYDHLTASQVAALFNKCPYSDPWSLYHEKTGRKPAVDTAGKEALFAKGHMVEVLAREHVEDEEFRTFAPAVVEYLEHPYLLASLDGLNEQTKTILEAKYVGRDRFKMIQDSVLPEHHVYQVQTQLMITGAEKCVYFAVSSDGKSARVNVEPDSSIHAEIARAAVEFEQRIKTHNPPECPWHNPNEEEIQILNELKTAKINLDAMSLRFDELKKQAFNMVPSDKPTKWSNLTLEIQRARGSIQYKNIPQLVGVDLENFRGKEVTRKIVRIKND